MRYLYPTPRQPCSGGQIFERELVGALVVPEDHRPLVDAPVVGQQHAAFARRERFAAHHRSRRHVANRADQPALVERAVGVRDILDHRDFVAASDLHDAIHIRGIAGVVHDQDRLGTRADAVLDVIRVDAQRLRVDVGEDDRAAERVDGRARRPVGDAGADDLVAVTDAQAEHRGVQRGSAGVVRQGEAHPVPGCVLFLEPHRHVDAGHGAGAQHRQHRLLDFGRDDRPAKEIGGIVLDCFRAAEKGEFACHPFLPMSDAKRQRTYRQRHAAVRKSHAKAQSRKTSPAWRSLRLGVSIYGVYHVSVRCSYTR